jgi:hypothetical protein
MQISSIPHALFNVIVTFNEGYYIADCEEIGLATEAKTFDELVARAREVGPDIAEANGIHITADDLSFTFFPACKTA